MQINLNSETKLLNHVQNASAGERRAAWAAPQAVAVLISLDRARRANKGLRKGWCLSHPRAVPGHMCIKTMWHLDVSGHPSQIIF